MLSEEGDTAVENSISQNLKEKLQASIPLGSVDTLRRRPFATKIKEEKKKKGQVALK